MEDRSVTEPGFYHVVLIRFHEPPNEAFLAQVQANAQASMALRLVG